MSQIEKRHGSILRVDEAESTLYIEAIDEVEGSASVEATLYVLCDREHALEVWHPWVLVRLSDQVQDGARFYLKRSPEAKGVRATMLEESDYLIKFSFANEEYRKELEGTLDTVVHGIRASPQAMHMRVQFGAIRLLEWEENKDDYTLVELKALADWAVPRGSVIFDTL